MLLYGNKPLPRIHKGVAAEKPLFVLIQTRFLEKKRGAFVTGRKLLESPGGALLVVVLRGKVVEFLNVPVWKIFPIRVCSEHGIFRPNTFQSFLEKSGCAVGELSAPAWARCCFRMNLNRFLSIFAHEEGFRGGLTAHSLLIRVCEAFERGAGIGQCAPTGACRLHQGPVRTEESESIVT